MYSVARNNRKMESLYTEGRMITEHRTGWGLTKLELVDWLTPDSLELGKGKVSNGVIIRKLKQKKMN